MKQFFKGIAVPFMPKRKTPEHPFTGNHLGVYTSLSKTELQVVCSSFPCQHKFCRIILFSDIYFSFFKTMYQFCSFLKKSLVIIFIIKLLCVFDRSQDKI